MKIAILSVALLSSIAAALPDDWDDWVEKFKKSGTYENKCETSDASPYLHNVNELIDNLSESTSQVCNSGPVNGCGETMTAWSGEGGAAFMVCGDSMRCSVDPKGFPCTMGCGGIQPKALGAYFQILRDDCQGPDSDGDIRVGGIVSQDDGETEYKLFSKPG